MNINRNNFEEFCLLYLDGELSQAERQELEAFVATNPDLAVELELLQQLKLKPETDSPVFFDKSSLFRSSAMENEAIHTGNYETFFLLYTDNELDTEGRGMVERFVMEHPEYQKEFNLLQASRLVAEPVSFPDKSLLYRKTAEPARISVMKYWRVAVAAAVILGGIWLGVNTQQHKTEAGPAMADTKKNNKVEQPKENKKQDNPTSEVAQSNTSETAVDNSVSTESVKQQAPAQVAVNNARNSKQLVQPAVKTKEEAAIAPDDRTLAKVEEPSNHLPTPDPVRIAESSETGAVSSGSTSAGLTPDVDIRDRAVGGPNAENAKNNFASEALLSASETQVYTTSAVQEDDHKSPLRGVFRKASRILNRVTNPDIFKPSSKQNK